MIDKLHHLEQEARKLDPSREVREHLAQKVLANTEVFLEDLPGQKAYLPTNSDADVSSLGLSENPEDIENILTTFDHHVVKEGINPASGGHLGYIPGGGLYPSALGDFLADISNKYAGLFYPAPGAVRLENLLIRWMCDLMGFPETASGNLTSGGSISNLVAVVTAREASGVKARDFEKLVVYTSDETHHSLLKALKIAGLGEVKLGIIPLDHSLRMEIDHLKDQITQDRAEGLIPFFINGSLGTTNTGTVDPIDVLADIAEENKIWFHVDAAYGGFFKLVPSLSDKFKGIERADSITLDPHKGLFLPFGTGAILVKDVAMMQKAHAFSADYLQDLVNTENQVNPADVSPELTKHFRGVRLWLPLKLFGLGPFRAALEEKVLLANYFHEEIQKIPGFQVDEKPDLSVATFRFLPENEDPNEFNKKLIKSVVDDGRIFLSSTTINGNFWIRVAVLIFRCHKQEIELLLDILKEKATILSRELSDAK